MVHVLWRTPQWRGEACSDFSSGSMRNEAVDWTVMGTPATNKQGQLEQCALIKPGTKQSHCGQNWNIFWGTDIDLLELCEGLTQLTQQVPAENQKTQIILNDVHTPTVTIVTVHCVAYLLKPVGCRNMCFPCKCLCVIAVTWGSDYTRIDSMLVLP